MVSGDTLAAFEADGKQPEVIDVLIIEVMKGIRSGGLDDWGRYEFQWAGSGSRGRY